MLRLVLSRLRPVRPRRLVVPLLVLLGCGLPALLGALVGEPMLSGGGLGVLTAALPPALFYAYAADPPDEGPGDDDGPGGGPDDPPDPGGQGSGGGLDWDAFDRERRSWDRTPVPS